MTNITDSSSESPAQEVAATTDACGEKRGLYSKYRVQKKAADDFWVSVEEPVFVLEYRKDRHAARAVVAYAESCREENPQLCQELLELVIA